MADLKVKDKREDIRLLTHLVWTELTARTCATAAAKSHAAIGRQAASKQMMVRRTDKQVDIQTNTRTDA